MRAGQRLNMTPTLHEWSFQRFDAKLPDNQYATINGTIPAALSGDIELTAYGKMRGELPGMFYTIRLPGPAMTVGH